MGSRVVFSPRVSINYGGELRAMRAMSNTSSASGDGNAAADTLFDTLYAELHRLARRELNRRGRIGGLGVTTLLHEAYLTISAKEAATFVDRPRFMAYEARVIRG